MLCTLVVNILYLIICVHYLILYVPRETLYLICSTWNVMYMCICLLVLVYVTGICVYIDYILSLYGIIILCVLDYYPCVRDYYFVCAGLYIRRLLLSYIYIFLPPVPPSFLFSPVFFLSFARCQEFSWRAKDIYYIGVVFVKFSYFPLSFNRHYPVLSS